MPFERAGTDPIPSTLSCNTNLGPGWYCENFVAGPLLTTGASLVFDEFVVVDVVRSSGNKAMGTADCWLVVSRHGGFSSSSSSWCSSVETAGGCSTPSSRDLPTAVHGSRLNGSVGSEAALPSIVDESAGRRRRTLCGRDRMGVDVVVIFVA
jgi:hypothetical protein